MAQAYSNPKRADDPHALPDVEVFFIGHNEDGCPACETPGDVQPDCDDHATHVGWYWWACFPGCMSDSEANGPFATEAEALADAQEGCDEDE